MYLSVGLRDRSTGSNKEQKTEDLVSSNSVISVCARWSRSAKYKGCDKAAINCNALSVVTLGLNRISRRNKISPAI